MYAPGSPSSALQMMYFGVRHGLAQELPLEAGEEAGAAAAAQLGGLDLLDHQFGIGVDQHLVERLVAADGDVLLDVVGLMRPQLRSTIFFCGLKNGTSCQEGMLG